MSVRCAVALLGLSLLSNTTSLTAQAPSDLGGISVQSAQLTETEKGWLLSAAADIRLSPKIRQGLDSGVPLQFIVEFQLKKVRPLLPDKTLLAIRHRYSLIYYVLTRHYRLDSIDSGAASTERQAFGSGKSRNYRSLLKALDALGDIQAISIERPALFDSDSEITGHLSIRLDDKALPLPLQSLLRPDGGVVHCADRIVVCARYYGAAARPVRSLLLLVVAR